MDFIKVKEELREWLADYITDTIHGFEAEDSVEFNQWAENFKKEEAEFVVNMEFVNDWGYDKRNEIPEEEAKDYANALLEKILDRWYL
jgi:hypothetical protein